MPTPKQLRIIRRAARKHGISPALLYGVWGAETNFAGARNAPRSSAGASGPFQFMPTTAPGYGVDPFDNNFRDDAFGAAKYLSQYKSRGVPGMLAAYNAGPAGNPNNSETQAYIPRVRELAGQWPGAPGGGRNKPRRGGGQTRGTPPTRTQLPGIDNSGARTQLLQSYLLERDDPSALISLGSGLASAQDIPGATLTQPGTPAQPRRRGGRGRGGGNLRTGGGQPVMALLRRAVKWDKAKVHYQWGGGHGSTAKPGTPVDCSGYWSGILRLKTPLTSGGFLSWGKPGEGRNVTIYTHQGHILGKIRDPRSGKWRWFGTSKSNPGGGAGEIAPPSASYLSAFVARHPG